MDQDLTWWGGVVLAGWRQRAGPRYRRIAAAVLEAIDDGRLPTASRLPAERILADALGVSRGTVVAALDQLAEAGAVRRRQGSGTYVAGRPGWTSPRTASGAAAILLRQLADREHVDLSLSVPAGTDHLPPVDLGSLAGRLSGHGLESAGLPDLREQIARHLTEHLQLPTSPEQLVVTTGAQQALCLIGDLTAPARASIVASCPSYPGLVTAFGTNRRARLLSVPSAGGGGIDPDGVARAARSAERPVVYVAPVANPAGVVLPEASRAALLDGAGRAGALVVEDLALADLVLQGGSPPPLAAMSDDVVSIGSLSKLFWAGLRVGWIRAPEPLRSSLLQLKAASDLASSIPSQAIAAQLLGAVDDTWLRGLRSDLCARRDRLASEVGVRVPAWGTITRPVAGLSLWVELPLRSADSFAQAAMAHGVTVAPGSTMCGCGHHRGHIRMSFAEPFDTLDLAAERLAFAWEAHCADVASAPHVADRTFLPGVTSGPTSKGPGRSHW